MSFPPRYRAKSRGDLSGEESRAKAVAVAIELFATSGFRGTSVAAVAARTGLSQSGLLHHFPSKAALLGAVLEERDRQDGDFLAGSTEPPLGWAAFDAWVREHYESLLNWLTHAVHIGQERGEISANAPVGTIVRTAIAVIDGLQQQWLLEPDKVSMAAEFEAFVATLRARWSTVDSG